MPVHPAEEAEKSPGINRRTVVVGSAWAVPAILIASAAPAMAGSRTVVLTGLGEACKHPGKSTGDPFTYHFDLLFTNNGTTTTTVTITSITLTPTSGAVVTFPATPSFDIAAGASDVPIQVHSNPSTNSANGQLTVTYDYTTPTGTMTATATINVTSLPPCAQNVP